MRRFIFYFILSMLSLSGCTQAVDDSGGREMSFYDLPKEVQDTILYWVENDIETTFMASDDTAQLAIYDKPGVICFDDEYTLESEKCSVGPWTRRKVLTRVSDQKEYSLTRNAPEPIIVRNDTIMIPGEYNILTVWDPTVKWKIYPLR